MSISDLPTLNATLNAISFVWLVSGYAAVRTQRLSLHRICMLGAVVTSLIFLTSYVIYHYNAGSKPFEGTGPLRLVYFAILVSHVILAATIVPLAAMTVTRALKGRIPEHRRIARRTLPLWLYVSVTGVIVYWMLYRL